MAFTNDYLLHVDIKKSVASQVPTFRQGDTARLRFRVYDNGRLMDLSDYTRSEITFRLPSGDTLLNDCELVDGIIEYEFNGTEMAEVGTVAVILSIYSNTTVVSIRTFKIHIYDNMRGEQLSYISILQDLIAEVTELEYQLTPVLTEAVEIKEGLEDFLETVTDNEAERYKNELDRVEAESDRVNAEDVRIANEINRVNKEALRVSAESSRESYETTRRADEVTRKNNESARVISENARRDAENTRISSETTRNNAENTRISSESTRQSQETNRVNAENVRLSAESTRISKETERTDAETIRVANENARIQAEELREIAIQSVEEIAEGFEFVGEFSPSATYEKYNIVSYNGSTYSALKEVTGITPTHDSVNWQMVAQRGIDGEGSVSSVNGMSPDLNGNVNINEASFTQSGLMTSAHVTKLSGIEDGANSTTIIDSLTSDSTTSAGSAKQLKVLKGLLDTHTGERNPHGLTKDDIGLNYVRNYDRSTEEQAIEGVSNTSYMTPLRVAQAISSQTTNKAPLNHTHTIAEVNGLQTVLDGKASSSHTHTISNVTGLQNELDGKSPAGHNHAISDITALQTELDAKKDKSDATDTYTTCSTAVGTAAKTASLTGFTLTTGTTVKVKFTNANTANNPTMNINSTGAKAIFANGTRLTGSNAWLAGTVLDLVYDGTQYNAIGHTHLNDTVNSTSIVLGATANSVKVVNDKVTQHLDDDTKHVTIAEKNEWNGKASQTTYMETIGTTWLGTTAPFTQVLTVSGILATDNPIISPVYSTTLATALLEKEAYNCISKAVTANGTITFTCFEEKPITAIPIQLKVVR